MSILSKSQIIERLFAPNLEQRLVISPILQEADQIGEGTVDLRLGTDFVISKRNDAHIFDPMNRADMEATHLRSDREYVEIGEKFHLHPNKVVLAGTFEYIRLPNDLAGRVMSRSSYERLGLSISTLANPGYRGSLTLALVNTGNTPLVLYPGVRIAQMTIHQIDVQGSPQAAYGGKYNHEVGPIFSRAHDDADLKIIEKIRKKS